MLKKIFVLLLSIFFYFFSPLKVFSLENEKETDFSGFEFVNQDFDQIFYSLSLYSGIEISADESVSGSGTFRMAGEDFEKAFSNFLRSNRLFAEKKDGCWIISRIRWEEKENDFFLEARDVRPLILAERIAKKFNEALSWEILPENNVSVTGRGNCAEDFLEHFVLCLGKTYSLEKTENGFHIARKEASFSRRDESQGYIRIEKYFEEEGEENERWNVDIKDGEAKEAFEKLFALSQKQFLIGQECNAIIRRCFFYGKSFEESLSILLMECGLDYLEKEGMFFIASTGLIKNERNSLLVWKKITCESLGTEKTLSLFASRFGQFKYIEIDGESFFLQSSEKKIEEMETFLTEIGEERTLKKISLMYIKTSDVLNHLPPFVKRDEILEGTEDNSFFFLGGEKRQKDFEDFIKELDIPVKRIRYDLFVVQYQRSENDFWDPSLSLRLNSSSQKSTSGLVQLGSVLNFNVDVKTAFGLEFASALQAKLDSNEAKVYADTTLFGVNGGAINFRNTSTYRYRDNNLDPETGEPVYSGVTREIASGLSIDISGWISGDGMITSKVSASITRQGADTSSTTGNPPPTSEKEITTEVRGKSGEPIVLTGLMQREESNAGEKVPLLWRIPLLGKLFSSHNKSNERTELIIYLVPSFVQEEVYEK